MKGIKKLIVVILLVMVGASAAFAQPTTGNKAEPQKKGFKRPKVFEKLYVGGGLGLQFGVATVIDISPLVLYEPVKFLQVGLGGTYIYNRVRFNQQIFQTNIYGGRAVLRLLPLRNMFSNSDAFFLHGEYEIMNLEDFTDPSILAGRLNIPAYNVGAGYQQAIGARSFTTLSFLFNLNDDPRYPFNNPMIRFGFMFGL